MGQETHSDFLFLTGLTTSGITGYKTLQKPPMTAGAEVELTQAVATADGEVLMEEFVSPALGITTIPAGNFIFSVYGAVDAADGVSELVGHVYQRTLAGTETELFNFTTGEIDALTATLYAVTYALASPVSTVITDRLVLKMYAKSSYASDITVSLFYLGEVNQSRLQLPVSLSKITGGDMLSEVYDEDQDGRATASAGGGDVLGNASVTDGHLAVFDGDGYHIKDGGAVPARQFLFTVEGDLTAATNPLRIYNVTGAAMTISKVFLAADTAPTGAAAIVDIHNGGTTIFTNQAHRPEIADGSYTGESTTIDDATWADGEYLQMIVDQIGSTVPGADLSVYVVAS
jgi:hypothetical protein